MLQDVEFLFDNQLIAAVEKLIRTAKKELLLVSPFIDLDARIRDALNEKKDLHDFQLRVLFGKNENNYYKSIKRNSLEELMQFPNVEIRYNERLHAKYFQNDFEFIMTSLNLYDFSMANNIEVGVKGQYASKGLLRRAMDTTNSLMHFGIDKVKQTILGAEDELHHVDKFDMIFDASKLVYKTQPKISESSGVLGFGAKKILEGFEIQVNELDIIKFPTSKKISPISANTPMKDSRVEDKKFTKYLSTSQLSKKYGRSIKEVNIFMQNKGLIINDIISDLGKSKGIVIKNYMGNNYIAYPEDLDVLSEFQQTI